MIFIRETWTALLQVISSAQGGFATQGDARHPNAGSLDHNSCATAAVGFAFLLCFVCGCVLHVGVNSHQ